MTGVETLEHIDGFSASDLPHYYPVPMHYKKVMQSNSAYISQ